MSHDGLNLDEVADLTRVDLLAKISEKDAENVMKKRSIKKNIFNNHEFLWFINTYVNLIALVVIIWRILQATVLVEYNEIMHNKYATVFEARKKWRLILN